jgi:hypothetical protein
VSQELDVDTREMAGGPAELHCAVVLSILRKITFCHGDRAQGKEGLLHIGQLCLSKAQLE